MEIIFEVIFQFVGEILLQLVFELIARIGFRSLGHTLKGPKNPILSTFGFILWGLIAGGISLLIFPAAAIKAPAFRVVNLVVTPVALGLIMMMIGSIRKRRGQELEKLDRFWYAFTFAFFMTLVRFLWAN